MKVSARTSVPNSLSLTLFSLPNPTDLISAPVDDLLDLVSVLLELEQHLYHRPFPLERVLLELVQIELQGEIGTKVSKNQ